MTVDELPWWPPGGDETLTESQVRELFASLRTVTPPVMEDAQRRIRQRVGDDMVRVCPMTAKSLPGRCLGSFNALKVVQVWARSYYDETVSVSIGIRRDGRLVTLEGTPERRQQEGVVCERQRCCSPGGATP